MEGAPTGIEVRLEFFPLGFFMFFCRPRVVIDGYLFEQGWWTPRFYQLAPGWHHVRIFVPYLFMPECGANDVDVLVQPGAVLRVNYFKSPWMFLKGDIRVRQPGQFPSRQP